MARMNRKPKDAKCSCVVVLSKKHMFRDEKRLREFKLFVENTEYVTYWAHSSRILVFAKFLKSKCEKTSVGKNFSMS